MLQGKQRRFTQNKRHTESVYIQQKETEHCVGTGHTPVRRSKAVLIVVEVMLKVHLCFYSCFAVMFRSAYSPHAPSDKGNEAY